LGGEGGVEGHGDLVGGGWWELERVVAFVVDFVVDVVLGVEVGVFSHVVLDVELGATSNVVPGATDEVFSVLKKRRLRFRPLSRRIT
jgi:hypothetical protein